MLQKNNNKAESLSGDAITVLFVTHVVLPKVLKVMAEFGETVMDKIFGESIPVSVGSEISNDSLDALVGHINMDTNSYGN